MGDVQFSQGNFATRNSEIRQKKSENDYMIMPENFNKIWSKKGGPDLPPPPPPPQKKKKKKKEEDLDSLSKFTY